MKWKAARGRGGEEVDPPPQRMGRREEHEGRAVQGEQ